VFLIVENKAVVNGEKRGVFDKSQLVLVIVLN
jgi:hypothetical protein